MTYTKPIVTLLSDFGLDDEYVGVMKGVLLGRNREIITVDLCHTVTPQNIEEAAHILSRSYSFFPEGTVHLAVVDPGVGSRREIIAIKASDHYFVGPDNGLFSFLLKKSLCPVVYRVSMKTWGGDAASNSFHGRDIMAPVAAHIACSQSIEGVGEETAIDKCIKIIPRPLLCSAESVRGIVVHVDHFGNLCTNIPKHALKNFPPAQCRITVGKTVIISVSVSYSRQDAGRNVALFDSHDFLEIAVKQGSASKILKIGPGAEVIVERQ